VRNLTISVSPQKSPRGAKGDSSCADSRNYRAIILRRTGKRGRAAYNPHFLLNAHVLCQRVRAWRRPRLPYPTFIAPHAVGLSRRHTPKGRSHCFTPGIGTSDINGYGPPTLSTSAAGRSNADSHDGCFTDPAKLSASAGTFTSPAVPYDTYGQGGYTWQWDGAGDGTRATWRLHLFKT